MNNDYVKTPFTNNPSMSRLEGTVFNQNPNERYLREKQIQIDLYGEKLIGETKISKQEGLVEKLSNFCNFESSMSLICLLYTSPSPRD